MAEEKKDLAPPGEEVLAQRLEAVEKKFKQIESLRKRMRWVLTLGALVLVFLLGVFVLRLWNQIARYPRYIKNFNQEAFVRAVTNPDADLAAITFSSAVDPQMDQAVRDAIGDTRATLKSELAAGQKQLMENVVPDFSAKLMAEFKKQLPEIEKRGGDMAGRLVDFSKKHVEERLMASLENGIKNSEKELKDVFPNLDERLLITNIDEGKQVFIDRLHDSLEERVAMVSSHLEGLKSAADHVAKSKGYAELNPDPAVRAEVEARLIETLLELAIYELDPVKGEQLAAPVALQGGAK